MSGTDWFVVVFLVGVNVQRLLETFKRRATVVGEQQMRWSFHAFFLLHVAIMVLAALEYFQWRRALHWGWTAVGLVLYVVSVVVRNQAIRALGRFWSLQIEIRQEHQLVRDGPYRYVRHPAYLAIVMEVLFIPLTVNAWWAMGFAAATYVPLLLWRLRWEERALVEKFGDVYRQYQRVTGALLPRLSTLWRRESPR